MKFGMFYQLPCAAWQDPYRRYQDTLEQIELGDKLGFDNAWLAELHFNRRFSITPSPLMVAAAAAQRTQRIRLGVAVNLLPLHQPIRLAEDIATLDLLSNGRAEFGVGRGAQPAHFRGFDIPQTENRERFVEGLEFIIRAWTHDDFSFEGKYYKATDLRLAPKPVQKPHPPVRIASNSADTFELVGQLGYHMFATPVVVPIPRLREGVEVYRHALAARGHGIYGEELALAIPTFVHRDESAARAIPQASVMNYVGTLTANYDSPLSHQAAAANPRTLETQTRFRNMTFDKWREEIGVYGNPAYCVDKLGSIQEQFKPGEYICWFETGGLIEHRQVMESMELFAQEVMPHFR